MRNKILGVIGIVWGLFILVNYFTNSTPQPGDAARSAGSMAGVILGGAMIIAGIFALVKKEKSADEAK